MASDDWSVPESTIIVEFLEGRFPDTPRLIPAEARAEKARKHLAASYGYLEQRLGQQDWVSASFSIADCALIPPLFYAQIAAPFNDRQAIVRYWQRAQQRPSYARVMAEFVPIREGMMKAGPGG